MQDEITRRIGLAYAAFRSINRKGIRQDNILSRRTTVTIYKVTILAILLNCSELWSIGPLDIKKLETTQMAILRHICGDKSWGVESTPYGDVRRKCQVPSIQQLITYHRLRWLEKVCRMYHDTVPIKTLFGKLGDKSLKVAPKNLARKTWLARDELSNLSKLYGILATYLDWWRLCRDRNG
jgi:hypothetical protein